MSSEMRELAQDVRNRFFWRVSPDDKRNHLIDDDAVRAVVSLCDALLARTEAGADGAVAQVLQVYKAEDEEEEAWFGHVEFTEPLKIGDLLYLHPQDASAVDELLAADQEYDAAAADYYNWTIEFSEGMATRYANAIRRRNSALAALQQKGGRAMGKLLPCPFCGDVGAEVAISEILTTFGKKHAVYCNTCFCEGPPAVHKDDAVTAWNARAALTRSEVPAWMVVERVRIENPDKLDPITVYLEDYGGRGRATITCFSSAWTCSWGAIGNRTLREFIAGCDESYVSSAMVSMSYHRVTKSERAYAARVARAVIDHLKTPPAQAEVRSED